MRIDKEIESIDSDALSLTINPLASLISLASPSRSTQSSHSKHPPLSYSDIQAFTTQTTLEYSQDYVMKQHSFDAILSHCKLQDRDKNTLTELAHVSLWTHEPKINRARMTAFGLVVARFEVDHGITIVKKRQIQ